MASYAYMSNRWKYERPQALLFADNPGTLVNADPEDPNSESFYVPIGYEINSNQTGITDPSLLNQFIILSDDNRQPIEFTTTRIENRQRTINGRMRSYHVADKLSISTSWSLLPSRSFRLNPNFNIETGVTEYADQFGKPNAIDSQYTSDGGAGGVELLKWYENHQGSFWVYLSYDKYSNFGSNDAAYGNLKKYNQAIEVFFADFQYSVVKRGGSNYDFWNISFTLEEA